jgi:SAM-dependent methyltransferase
MRALPAGVQLLLYDILTSRSPDRALLAKIIIPTLAQTRVLSCGADALWIGCRRYTVRYYRLIEARGARCWTLDIDPSVRRWGRTGRHIVGDMLELDRLFPDMRFDVVLCNGVFGWGVDTPSEQKKAYAALASITKPGGLLLLGWNTDRISDPSEANSASFFEPSCLPGFGTRKMVKGCTHVYDVLRRRSEMQ